MHLSMHLSPARAALRAALGLAALVPAAAQAQDLFVGNNAGSTISRFAAIGPGMFSATPTKLTAPSLNGPRGLAFDAHGDLFVANDSTLGVYTITEFRQATPGTFGAATTLTDPSLVRPTGLAFDSKGDLFVANTFGGSSNKGTITEFAAGATPGTFGAVTTFTDPTLNVPESLAFDAKGDLFVTNAGAFTGSGSVITEFTAGAAPGTFGPTTTLTDPSLKGPIGLTLDARGDLFAATAGFNTITEFAAGGHPGTFGAVTVITDATLNNPVGLAVDASGDLFAVNNQGNAGRFGTGIVGSVTEFASTGPGTFGAGQTIETGPSSPQFLAFGPSVPPALSSLTFSSPVPGGTVVTPTVTLSGPALADIVVGLSSSDSSVVHLHRAVIVPAGSSSATFEIDTFRSHVTKTVTITATLNGVVLTKDLTITGR